MTSFCFGQTLTLGSGSSITISSNGSLILSGLELDPSENYTISGPNVISRSSIPIEIGGKSSIDRVLDNFNTWIGKPIKNTFICIY